LDCISYILLNVAVPLAYVVYCSYLSVSYVAYNRISYVAYNRIRWRLKASVTPASYTLNCCEQL
jgi:hypothetical protein